MEIKVVLCTFTEGDLNLTERVFKDMESAERIISKEVGYFLEDYEAESLQDLLDWGFIVLEEVWVES